jgi:hypothetical protein
VAKEDCGRTVWVSVLVQSGIPVDVRAFRDSRSAQSQLKLWRKDIRPDYDDGAVFEVDFPSEIGADACVGDGC